MPAVFCIWINVPADVGIFVFFWQMSLPSAHAIFSARLLAHYKVTHLFDWKLSPTHVDSASFLPSVTTVF
jgi:hypothetical protein